MGTNLTEEDMDPEIVDGDPALPCLRTLGTGPGQACAGDDPRLSALAPQFVDNETPVKTSNPSNKEYSLTYAPTPPASLQVFVSGVFMVLGADYTVVGNLITFTKKPGTSAAIRAYYRR